MFTFILSPFRLNTRLQWVAFGVLAMLCCVLPQPVFAHQNPGTIILLDVGEEKVSAELQIPTSELALAYGHDVSRDLLQQRGQVEQYLLAHISPTSTDGKAWKVSVLDMVLGKAVQDVNGIPYQELIVHLDLQPPAGTDLHHFVLIYDAVMHQVVTHSALVSVRSYWETGKNGKVEEVGSIRVDTQTGEIYPLQVDLESGSWFTGFKSMLLLGMQHIKEGTDHLLFLLVLLLPAMLFSNGKTWGGFGGTRYSLTQLLKTTTAFTIGHSLTLLIGALQLIHLPPQPVEVLIAFSILVSAIHAITPVFAGREMYIAGGFGLVHGLAFASVLFSMNLSPWPMALSILGFNIGIELMQLLVILMVMPWLVLLSSTPAYSLIRIIAAILAGIAALAWMLERITGAANLISRFVMQGSRYGYLVIFVLAAITIFVFSVQRTKTSNLLS